MHARTAMQRRAEAAASQSTRRARSTSRAEAAPTQAQRAASQGGTSHCRDNVPQGSRGATTQTANHKEGKSHKEATATRGQTPHLRKNTKGNVARRDKPLPSQRTTRVSAEPGKETLPADHNKGAAATPSCNTRERTSTTVHKYKQTARRASRHRGTSSSTPTSSRGNVGLGACCLNANDRSHQPKPGHRAATPSPA